MNQLNLGRSRLRFGNWPIRYKLLVGVGLAAVLPLVFAVSLTLVRYLEVTGAARAYMDGEVEQGVERLNGVLDDTLTAVEQEIPANARLGAQVREFLAAQREAAQSGTQTFALPGETNLNIALQFTLINHRQFASIRLLDANGNLLADVGATADTPSIEAEIQTDHPTYLRALESLQGRQGVAMPVLVGPYPDPLNRQILMEVAAPITDAGVPVGYLMFSLNAAAVLDETIGVVESQTHAGEGDPIGIEGVMYLADGEGNVFTTVGSAAPFTRSVPAIIAAAEQRRRGSVQYESDWGDGPFTALAAYASITRYNWLVVSEDPLAPLLAPVADLAVSTLLPLVLSIVFISIVLTIAIDRQIIRPLLGLARVAQQFTEGDYSAQLPARRYNDEIGLLTSSFGSMADNARTSIELLEQRVRERTRDIEMTTFIVREVSALHDVKTLLDDTVNLVVRNFRTIYHAQVFLVDESGQDAVLVASTGDPGRQLLARGHRLAVGSLSVIGRVTESGQTVIARDTSASQVHRKNEFLPDTRAEMALPLVRGNQVLGALDLQSSLPDAFTVEDQRTFEALAAQLAVAIDNARLFAETERRAAEVGELNRLMMRTGWRASLASGRRQGTVAAAVGEQPSDWSAWQQAAFDQRDLVISPRQPDGTVVLAAPILLRGEPLGAVEWVLPPYAASEHARQMAREMVARLAVTLENVRLLEQSEWQAERERLVNQITGHLNVQPTVDHILRAAVHEVSQVLGTAQVSIQLKRPNGAPERGSTESA